MMRAVALSLLLAIGVSLAAPALVPSTANAATTEAVVEGGLPALPWRSIAQWVLKNALTLLMLAEEIWRDVQGGPEHPGDTQPPPAPPPNSLTVDEG